MTTQYTTSNGQAQTDMVQDAEDDGLHTRRVIGLFPALPIPILSDLLLRLPQLSPPLVNGYPLIQYGIYEPLPEPGFNGAPSIGRPLPPRTMPQGLADPTEEAECEAHMDLRQGAVFTLLNLRTENRVRAYGRRANGSLCLAGSYHNGGASNPLAMAAVGQPVVAAQENYVLAISPGTADDALGAGSLSVFRIEPDGLVLTDVESTGAPHPRSVTYHGDLVYVVNAGALANASARDAASLAERVRGYRLDMLSGNLTPLPGADVPTLDPQGDPAWIRFTPEGDRLLVFQRRPIAESGARVRRYVEVMQMGAHDVPMAVTRYEANSEPLPGPHAHADVLLSGTPYPVSTANDVDACWNYVSRSTAVSYLYTPAFPVGTIGPLPIHAEGSLAPIIPHPASASGLEHPIPAAGAGGRSLHGVMDMSGREYLYVLDSPLKLFGSSEARITGFSIGPADGSLAILDVQGGLPGSTFGLWAF